MNKSNLSIEDLSSLRNEVQIMQSVDHPNIVEYYETYEDKGYIYLCMELCTGGELIEKLTSAKNNHLNEKICAEYMLKLFKAYKSKTSSLLGDKFYYINSASLYNGYFNV